MNPLKEYAIPVRGLKPGPHEYRFSLDWRFFQEFEGSPVRQARLETELVLDKHSDHFVVEIGLEGTIHAPCDRCLAEVDIPVSSRHYLIVKYGESMEDEAEVIYISRDAPEWNVAQILYEYSLLALPITLTFDCESRDPRPCDLEMLKRLGPLEEETNDNDVNPIWEELKKTFGNT